MDRPKWSTGFQHSDSELAAEKKAARDKHFTSERYVGGKYRPKKAAGRKAVRKGR